MMIRAKRKTHLLYYLYAAIVFYCNLIDTLSLFDFPVQCDRA